MKCVLLIALFLCLPDSSLVKVKFDSVQRGTLQQQTITINKGVDSLSLKLDMLIELLESKDTINRL